MRRVALCADDFGHGPAVDAAVLRLVDEGRLGGVSCQVTGRAWREDAAALAARAGEVDLGLHLDLAEGRAGLAALLAGSGLRVLPRDALARAIRLQLDAFERAAGRPPAFVDGHQHVHQLPVVRDALLDALARRYGSPGPLVRCTVPARWRGAKPAVLAALGGRGLRAALRRRGVPHNSDFVGVYPLDAAADYRRRARAWLAGAADRAIWMCHPGLAPGDAGDPIAAARAAEHAYLCSDALLEDCAAAGVDRVRVSAVA